MEDEHGGDLGGREEDGGTVVLGVAHYVLERLRQRGVHNCREGEEGGGGGGGGRGRGRGEGEGGG